MFVVYIIYSKKLNRYYIGTTDDFERRYAEHNSHHFSDSFTSKVIPCDKFLVIGSLTSDQAYKIETHIKRMKSKTYISNLIKYPKIILRLKQMYLLIIGSTPIAIGAGEGAKGKRKLSFYFLTD
jgi:putative endonuclease